MYAKPVRSGVRNAGQGVQLSGEGMKALVKARAEPGLWLQDWNSLNGTYYCRSLNGERDGRSKWKVLHGQVLLNSGAHFRLGDKVVEFS